MTAALARGAHVLCEKPFALDRHEAAAMVRASVETGRTITAGFNLRFTTSAQQVAPARQRHNPARAAPAKSMYLPPPQRWVWCTFDGGPKPVHGFLRLRIAHKTMPPRRAVPPRLAFSYQR